MNTEYIETGSVSIVLATNGKGYWSRRAAEVKHTQLILRVSTMEDHQWGELRVLFDPKDWDVKKHGLIYSDQLWEKELKAALVQMGFSEKEVAGVNYSEQGMQGKDYVSLDVDDWFIRAFTTKYGSATKPVK